MAGKAKRNPSPGDGRGRGREAEGEGNQAAELRERLLDNLMEARSMIEVACKSLQIDDDPPEAIVLRSVVRILNRIYEEVDRITS